MALALARFGCRRVCSIRFRPPAADTSLVTQLIEKRWKRYGKDRVYVKTSEGNEVGHVDLVEQTVVATIADYETELRACLCPLDRRDRISARGTGVSGVRPTYR